MGLNYLGHMQEVFESSNDPIFEFGPSIHIYHIGMCIYYFQSPSIIHDKFLTFLCLCCGDRRKCL